MTWLTIGTCGLFNEGVNPRCNGAFITQVPWDPALVLSRRSSDEGRVVDQTVLGGVSFRLQGTKQRFLSTQDLHCGGGALGQWSERPSLLDQTGCDCLSDKSRQIGCHSSHLLFEVRVQLLSVQREGYHTFWKELRESGKERWDVVGHPITWLEWETVGAGRIV